MIDPEHYRPLHFKINTNETLDLLSTLTQDALCNVTSMHFYADKEVFSLRLNRFCWELVEKKEALQSYFRVHSTLSFHGVKHAQKRNFTQCGQVRSLNLLSIMYQQSQEKEKRIRLLFSGDMDLDIILSETGYVQANDFGHPWPTHNMPIHLHDHFEQLNLKDVL